MKTIRVTASQSYDVHIGSGLIDQAGQQIRAAVSAKTAVIITDTNVGPLYANRLCDSLRSSDILPIVFTFPAGEESKNLATYSEVLNLLVEKQVTRSDLLIALGGGVVGDITGFAAATYLRGIPFVQIPTSLLAMVDSSVGGKTAVDLPGGKNLVGAFYQPKLVLCDTDLLATLPRDVFLDGCAEVLKYGVLFDSDFLTTLTQDGTAFQKENVISRCVELKRDVVANDEFDNGQRQLLNLGHTVGHAIEALSQYTISHGNAVAAGMAIIARAAFQNGLCSKTCSDQIIAAIHRFELPDCTCFSAEQLVSVMLSDKKRAGNTIHLIVPTEIGSCIRHPIPVTELETFIKAGL